LEDNVKNMLDILSKLKTDNQDIISEINNNINRIEKTPKNKE